MKKLTTLLMQLIGMFTSDINSTDTEIYEYRLKPYSDRFPMVMMYYVNLDLYIWAPIIIHNARI